MIFLILMREKREEESVNSSLFKVTAENELVRSPLLALIT
jgi:hypothetical protein